MTKELYRKRFGRETGSIVFPGPTNFGRSNDVIHFPDEVERVRVEEGIDLSGSFAPINPIKPPIEPENKPLEITGTFANCGAFSANGTFVMSSADSGIYIFPNGTKISYSKCLAILQLRLAIEAASKL